jgi:hypothetical protein
MKKNKTNVSNLSIGAPKYKIGDPVQCNKTDSGTSAMGYIAEIHMYYVGIKKQYPLQEPHYSIYWFDLDESQDYFYYSEEKVTEFVNNLKSDG